MEKPHFTLLEVRNIYQDVETPILKFWQDNSIFQKSIDNRSESDTFIFYDGPPFVTGTPHYGHLLGSVIKDIIPRFQTMLGKRVDRMWGWDCHGLPIEEKVERKLGTKNRREIESKFGIKAFTDQCLTYVNDISAEWNWYIDRIARWVDMDKPYRTMDLNYMETVLWVFKEIYNKGLIYKGKRVSLYCTRCGTPVSHFEIVMDNSYKDVEDPSVVVKFPAKYYKTGVGVGIVIRNDKGEILTMIRNEPGRDKVLGIVGGKCDEEDATVLDTVHREALEEIGVDVKDIKYYGYAIDIFEGRLFKTHHFSAQLIGEPKLQAEDIGVELKWTKEKDLAWDNMHIPTRNCLKDVLSNKPVDFEPTKIKPKVSILAWTTTPWTLPENAALAVDSNIEYVTIKPVGNKDEYYVLAKARLEHNFETDTYTIIDTYPGKELVNLSYEPLFTYFESNPNDYKVYAATFVTTEDGTGIVHVAPGYGEDDTELGKEHDLSIFDGIDDEGKMVDSVKDFKGIYLKDADPLIIEYLDKAGLLFSQKKYLHSYPMCYRCGKPLIYKSQDSWYVDIPKIREDLIKNNEQINWVPEHIKHGRFLDSIKTFETWGISRTRYWASPMPIWECDKCDNREVLGSIKEIEDRSGKKVTNLHRPYIDEHTYTCSKCGGTMRRIPEVLDCWLESASMPFAQYHYPFENKEKFEKNYPGDFVAEYVAQTRAWFNLMHVVSTILKDSPAFKNVIVSGVIKGTDGRKMSKSFGNYPDPKLVIEKYGGDAFRFYSAGSVLCVAVDMNINEDAISQPIKDVLLPLVNTYKYLALYANQHEYLPEIVESSSELNVNSSTAELMDKWILTRTQDAVNKIHKYMSEYVLPTAVSEVKPLIDDISTWYIRRSRERFVAGDKNAINTLYTVLFDVIRALAPLIPFTTEYIFQLIKDTLPPKLQKESVHLTDFPKVSELSTEDEKLLTTMTEIRNIASIAQSIRVSEKLPLKQPLANLAIKTEININEQYKELLKDELNVEQIIVGKIPTGFVSVESKEQIVALDTTITEELKKAGLLREVIRTIQAARKSQGFKLGDTPKATLFVNTQIRELIEAHIEEIIKKASLSRIELVNGEAEKLSDSDIKLE